MYGVVEVGEVTTLEWALVVLFVVNFYWIALSFVASLLGFRRLVAKSGAPGPPAPASGGQDRDRHADLQRGALAGVRGDAGD